MLSFGEGERDLKIGISRTVKIIRRAVVIINGVECIAFTWSCTKSFWCLRPMDVLLSFKSFEGASESNRRNLRVAAFFVSGPLSVDKGILTSIFRITI